jgi:ssDNA-binding Zn-finger/Zn-ribbon topoisomerase 1
MSNGPETETPAALVLAPKFVVGPTDIKVRIAELQDFVKAYMIEGEDYGTIPGTAKPTLYKSGAEKLCDVYGFQRLFQTVNRVEDWEKGLFHYEIRADLVDSRTGLTVAQGLGSANTMEARYRWRKQERTCPQCNTPAIIEGKAEFGGGWVCWKKRGGCGANFEDIDPAILSQKIGRIENDDPFTLVNTILKMAKKRALVDAVLSATRSSGLFTQDVEDMGVIESEIVREPVDDGPTESGPHDPPPAAAPANTQGRQRRPPAKSKATLEAEAKGIRAGKTETGNGNRPWRCGKCRDDRLIPAKLKDCPYCGHRRGAKIKTPAAAETPAPQEAKGDGDPTKLTEAEQKAEQDAQASASEGEAKEEADATAESERIASEAEAELHGESSSGEAEAEAVADPPEVSE